MVCLRISISSLSLLDLARSWLLTFLSTLTSSDKSLIFSSLRLRHCWAAKRFLSRFLSSLSDSDPAKSDGSFCGTDQTTVPIRLEFPAAWLVCGFVSILPTPAYRHSLQYGMVRLGRLKWNLNKKWHKWGLRFNHRSVVHLKTALHRTKSSRISQNEKDDEIEIEKEISANGGAEHMVLHCCNCWSSAQKRGDDCNNNNNNRFQHRRTTRLLSIRLDSTRLAGMKGWNWRNPLIILKP